MPAVIVRVVVCRLVRIAAVRRAAVIAVLGALVAGCGGEETVTPTAETVIGEQPQAQPQAQGDPQAGKAVFAAKGCGGCHTFQPAGPTAKGTTGPDLDNLQQYAETAGQPLDEFVRQSITQPDAYVQPGYPEGVMPAWSGTEKELNDLVAFLTQS
jgi:mono/diheme cytochrome c family protein